MSLSQFCSSCAQEIQLRRLHTRATLLMRTRIPNRVGWQTVAARVDPMGTSLYSSALQDSDEKQPMPRHSSRLSGAFTVEGVLWPGRRSSSKLDMGDAPLLQADVEGAHPDTQQQLANDISKGSED